MASTSTRTNTYKYRFYCSTQYPVLVHILEDPLDPLTSVLDMSAIRSLADVMTMATTDDDEQ